MKMVYTAKLRRSQASVLDARPYAAALDGVLRSLAGRIGAGRHPLLVERPEESVTLVVVAGDKGLCGAFNSNVLREAAADLVVLSFPLYIDSLPAPVIRALELIAARRAGSSAGTDWTPAPPTRAVARWPSGRKVNGSGMELV